MNSIIVECLECGKKFKTSSLLPVCPMCGGSDIEPAEPVLTRQCSDGASVVALLGRKS